MKDTYESPLASRYASREMLYIFSPDKKFTTWRRLWIALARAEMELGLPITQGQIDEMEREIEALCMKILLQQQPVASDLRVVSSALKMISDMERIGDQAADIAELCPYVGDTLAQGRLHITNMARAAVSMVTESVEAFVQGDLKMACKVVQDDDKVDELFLKVRAELIGCLKEEVGDPEAILDLLMIAKYFERIGDHAVNVAEWVEYSITGIHESNEHHPQNVL